MAVTTKQLDQYRAKLIEMRRRVQGQVEHVVHSINDESNTLENLSSVPLHLADVAQPGLVADAHVLDCENDLLHQIDAALARVTDGTYGACSECGEDIPRERLQALPFSTTCTACAQADEDAARPKPR